MTLGQRVKDGLGRFAREARLEVSAILLMTALFFLIEAITQTFWADAPGLLKDLHRLVGNWVIWAWFGGFILTLIAGWYTFESVSMRREFRRLVDTTSKQKFLRNRERLELLAYTLPRIYETKFLKKMAELEVT